MSEHRKGEHDSHTAKIIAEVGVVSTAAVAISGGMYRHWKRQHEEVKTYGDVMSYQSSLDIFSHPKLKPAVRTLLGPLAVRIYHASLNTPQQIITRTDLEKNFEETKPHNIQKALSYLSDGGLIGRRVDAMGSKQQGYFALSSLDWAIQEGDCDPLAQAYAEFLDECINGSL